MMKSMSRSKARRSPSSENSFAGSRDQIAWNVLVHVQQAEQVVEPVVEGVRIALDVEEQVARRRRRERRQAAIDVDLAAGSGRSSSYLSSALAPTLQLDPRLFVDADERALADALELRLHRQGEVAERLAGWRRRARRAPAAAGPRSRRRGSGGRHLDAVSRIRPPSGRRRSARRAPGMSPRAGRSAASRRPASPGNGRGRSGSRPCSRRRAGARRCGRCRRGRRGATRDGRPGCRSSWSTYEQIWRIALALTWRASLVSATS